jgi:hypothetical protein
VTVRLADIIEVLDAVYPPQLAQSWDSVGLVCGEPGDPVDSVVVAVDATVAVVDEVPDRACCWRTIAAAARGGHRGRLDTQGHCCTG